MASIYVHRTGFQAAVTVKGQSEKRNFATRRAAENWARAREAELRRGPALHLGGPTRVTLGQALFEYAKTITIHKKSCVQELAYINRYLQAVGLPRLKLQQDETRLQLLALPVTIVALPSGFTELQQLRQTLRSGTNDARRQLAQTLMSKVTTAQLRHLVTLMYADGLRTNTIRKERALLRHLFNIAKAEWHWEGFHNPCDGLRLEAPLKVRHVVYTAEMDMALRAELAKLKTPLVLQLFEFALEVSSRKSSLLRLEWTDINWDTREMCLRTTKNGDDQMIPLSLRAVAILKQLQQSATGPKVFPMSANALGLAMRRAAERIGLDIRFRDTRHIALTRLGKRLRCKTACNTFQNFGVNSVQ